MNNFLTIYTDFSETSIRKEDISSITFNWEDSCLTIKTKTDVFEFSLLGKRNEISFHGHLEPSDENEIDNIDIALHDLDSYDFISIRESVDKVYIWRFATQDDYEEGFPTEYGVLCMELH